jgi:ParB-like chromosome segregation protein Spo0J
MTTATTSFNLELMQIPGSDDCALSGSLLDPARIIEQVPEVSIPVSSLGPAFHLRQSGTDITHVRMLADTADHAKLPPILVQKHSSRIIDGMHRVEVAKLRGEWSIKARLVDCTDEEALVLAVRANTLHGLPLSRADRISSAKRILANHPDWSDRALAGIAGLSAKSIASLRNSTTGETQLHVKRLGRDGKRRPVVAGEGRQRAAEYINAHPEASLRQVAREADVSIGTVHDVRERLRRGVLHLADAPVSRAGQAESDSTSTPGLAADAGARPASPPRTLPMRRAAGNPRQFAWAAISAKLAGDPALRYTEGGRAFLRWMSAHSMQADEWREFIDAVPQRWLGEVCQIAASMTEEWRQFADQLRLKQEEAS